MAETDNVEEPSLLYQKQVQDTRGNPTHPDHAHVPVTSDKSSASAASPNVRDSCRRAIWCLCCGWGNGGVRGRWAGFEARRESRARRIAGLDLA